MNLEIRVDETNGIVTVFLVGEIDAYTVPELQEIMDAFVEEKKPNIIVDLEKVNYMDSTGVGMFIGTMKSVKEYDGNLQLLNMQDRVYRLFQITGLTEVMDVKAAIRGESK